MKQHPKAWLIGSVLRGDFINRRVTKCEELIQDIDTYIPDRISMDDKVTNSITGRVLEDRPSDSSINVGHRVRYTDRPIIKLDNNVRSLDKPKEELFYKSYSREKNKVDLERNSPEHTDTVVTRSGMKYPAPLPKCIFMFSWLYHINGNALWSTFKNPTFQLFLSSRMYR